MGRNKQPIELVIANGKKHLTKEEINFRRESEVKPITDNIEAPSYLTAKQKKEFNNIANKLIKLKIMGETDIDALARYIISNDLYLNAVKQLRKKKFNQMWIPCLSGLICKINSLNSVVLVLVI